MIVIDGHNLIPKIKGWSLSDLDDEAALIQALIAYTKNRRGPVEVFFDGAPPGRAGQQRYGRLTAHFVAAGLTADQAIRRFLESLGNQARNASVVSSDRAVQANARELRARVIPSETFALQLTGIGSASQPGSSQTAAKARGGRPAAAGAPAPLPEAKKAPPGKLEEWLEVFGIEPEEAEKPIELGKRTKKGPKPGRGPKKG